MALRSFLSIPSFRRTNIYNYRAFSSASSLVTAKSSFCIVGSETKELDAEEVERLYSRPAALKRNKMTELHDQEQQQQQFLSSSTGPLLDLSVIGVVKNPQVSPADELFPILKCDVLSSWISPSRGAVSDFIVDKQVFKVQIKGKRQAKIANDFLFQQQQQQSENNGVSGGGGVVCYFHGRLILKPMFDPNNFNYQYYPELVVSDEYGWAECLMYEKVEGVL